MSYSFWENSFGSCICGGAWFELALPDDAEGTDCPPAVCIDVEGNINGYAGKLVCIECGTDWDPHCVFTPGSGHLRVVGPGILSDT